MACAPSGHLVRFLFASQRTATQLGAQTGKSVFRRHSRAASALPVLRFIDSPFRSSLHAQRKAAEDCRTPKAGARPNRSSNSRPLAFWEPICRDAFAAQAR